MHVTAVTTYFCIASPRLIRSAMAAWRGISMRRTVLASATTLFLMLSSAFTTAQVPSANAASIAITNVTLIDGTGRAPRTNATVVIEGTRIARIETGAAHHAAITVFDGRGKFLIPGLWDMHAHLAYVGDITASTLVAYGVTSVRDLGGSLSTVDWIRDRIRRGTLIGPRILRAGPLVDGAKPGSQDRLVIANAPDAVNAVDFLKAHGVDFIKVHNGVPAAAYFSLLTEARRQGLSVVGHIPQEVDPGEAIDAGHESVEHIVSLFEGPVRRKVIGGLSEEQAIAEFTDDEAIRLARKMVAQGTWFDPTLVTYWYRAHQWEARARADNREQYVTASMRANWKNFPPLRDDARIRALMAKNFERFVEIVRILHREGVRMLTGTDLCVPYIYPGASVHEEMAWLVKAGLTPMEALIAATRNGAEATGRHNEIGSIEPGKLADMVLLEADPIQDISNTLKIAAVITDGKLLRREQLNDLLAEVAERANAR